ncbi:lipopolysaccharide transport periplasmic protein LptA [Alteromonas sediminis]|uniref:Lipopolysaccharide export system protein LptA n=1 Tax=Alteromonas sediminis TaxID=2259342 RepID=A0A3N5YQ18_9ALTE|nr:lipopolysaccharide transport periplasmic protein LptA [Alteromonas sediminis]RPJ68061.1 lipopolysaccharide transport periplasmic protein LptA [Alteromonas sediminis]
MLKPSIHLLLSSLLAIGLASPSLAGEEDFEKPVEISSDHQFADGKEKVSFLRGNVVIRQGSLLIKADELEIDASQGEGKEVFTAKGSPASYSQQLDDGQTVSAKATEITYQLDTRILSLVGSAELIRDTSSVSGGAITFDMINEQLLADGTGNEDGRVTTVFKPGALPGSKKKEKEEPPAQ